MIKVLHVYPQLMCGGTETVISNLIKYGDHTRYQYDLLVQRKGQLEGVFEGLGCRIITIPYITKKQYQTDLTEFFTQNSYQVVHCHMHEEMPIVLEQACKAGVTHRISHSHNARVDFPGVLWLFRYFKHHKYEKYATDLFGCSKLALKWLFPCRWRDGIVVYNGIELNTYQFNQEIRSSIRSRLGIHDYTKIIINVGRCTSQKNQGFILDRAKDLSKKDFLFIIIGEGPLLESLEARIKEESISNVLLMGKQLDIPNWLCAADLFVFPSIYEGLGIVAIEAQTNGLPVLSTESIPEEADMKLGLLHRVKLDDKKSWTELISSISIDENTRKEKSNAAFNSDYNINNVVKMVETVYLR